MQKPKETRPDSTGVKVCTFVGALVGFALMMIGNLVFRVVVGGAIGGAIGATVGGAGRSSSRRNSCSQNRNRKSTSNEP